MSLSQRKGNLGAIRVAAYCFKKLKKAQVKETDISASVDKLLQDEWDVVAYRVLAYLLLGVVRIYSKKAEYLFNDCNEMLREITKFVVRTEANAPTKLQCAPYHHVIVPDRFELDAFDMGIFEDISREHLVCHKDITLKDCANWNGIGQLSSGMYDCQEFGACHSIFSDYYIPVRNTSSVLSSHLMGFDMELITSSNGATSEGIVEKLQWNGFSQEECTDLVPNFGSEKEPENKIEQFGEDHKSNGEQIKAPNTTVSEFGIPEEGQNCESCYGNTSKPSCHFISADEDHHSDREEMMEVQLAQPENQMCQFTREDSILSNLEANMEKNTTVSQEAHVALGVLTTSEQPQKFVGSYIIENHNNGEPTKLEEMISLEHMINTVKEDSDPHSIARDISPDTNLPDSLGVTTPKLTVVPRPASKGSAQISKKRKCIFDEILLLSNEIIRQSIHDATSMVAKRRKVPQNALAVWRTHWTGNLAQNFLEPLISSASQELRSLLCKRKPWKLKTTSEELINVLECPSTGMSQNIETTETSETPEILKVVKYPSTVRPEEIEIAPGTPVILRKSMKSLYSPNSPIAPNMESVRPEISGRIDKDVRAIPEIPLHVPCLDREHEEDFNLLSEEANFSEVVNPELAGWSMRTRMVARYLDRNFRSCQNQGEEEVNLLQVSKRRTKKESARLFYETLVLKTIGFVDVKQENPYGDILIRKLPKWKQTWPDDTFV